MKDPFWLRHEILLAVHGELLARFGGPDGIRDQGMFDSALSRPLQLHHYNDKVKVFDLAACYAFGLIKNHPFIDGNKRIGFLAAYIFLGMNGYHLTAPEEEVVIMTRGLASGEFEEADYAAWLKKSCNKR